MAPSRPPPSMAGLPSVQRDSFADQCLERGLVDLIALVEVDGTPGVAFEARVEEFLRILDLRTFEERQLHDALVCLSRTDHPVLIPDRNSSPLPFFNNGGSRLFDESTQPG